MYITIKNTKIHYIKEGAGTPLLMLHGWGANIESFRPIIDDLKKHFTIYALDFPGFGQSEEPKSIWHVKDYTAMTVEFMNELLIEDPIIMCHSFGGRVSIELAGQKTFSKAIFIDAAGIKPSRPLSYYVKVYSYKTIRFFATFPLIKWFFKETYETMRKNSGSTDYKQASDTMKGILSKAVNYDQTHLLKQVTCPTLLCWGELDTATPLSDGQLMEDKMPDAGLVTFKGAGHFSYLERQDEFLAIIYNFLEITGGDTQ